DGTAAELAVAAHTAECAKRERLQVAVAPVEVRLCDPLDIVAAAERRKRVELDRRCAETEPDELSRRRRGKVIRVERVQVAAHEGEARVEWADHESVSGAGVLRGLLEAAGLAPLAEVLVGQGLGEQGTCVAPAGRLR